MRVCVNVRTCMYEPMRVKERVCECMKSSRFTAEAAG